MNRKRVIIGLVALVAIAAVVGGIVISSKGAGTLVKTAVVAEEGLSVIVNASGKVEADTKADLYPPAAGTLKAVYAKDGQVVKAGQKLALLDQGALDLQVKQAEAALQQAYSGVAGANAQFPASIDKQAANAAVIAALAAYESAKDGYAAARSAYNQAPIAFKASAEATMTAAKLQRDQAYSAYLQARSARSRLDRTGAASAQKRAGTASVEQAQAALSLAESSADKALMEAPINGIVVFNALGAPSPDGSTPKAAIGASVSPASPLFTIIRLSELQFTAEVDETEVSKVARGMKCVVTLDAFPGQTFVTKVDRVKPIATLTSSGGTAFQVVMALRDLGVNLGIGMQGNAEISVSDIPSTLTVPIEALFDEGAASHVFVVANAKLEKRTVTVGTLTDTQAQILEGLKAGDVVALSGATTFTDGMAVRTK